MSNSTMHNSVAGPELTEDELGHVSGGKPSAAPKQEAVFPTEVWHGLQEYDSRAPPKSWI